MKADAAAEVAAAKERAAEEVKEMTQRLGSLSSQLAPMMEAIKFVSSNYKQLRKDARDLQGEVQPAIKQCKRDMLRALADADKQYKEMLRKYRKEVSSHAHMIRHDTTGLDRTGQDRTGHCMVMVWCGVEQYGKVRYGMVW